MDDVVLVTGAFGLVGTATLAHLGARGRRVVATDLDTPANRAAAAKLPGGIAVRWADLTDPTQTAALLADVRPSAVVHLAAVIPPLCYAKPDLARAVNVGATANLAGAAAALDRPPRFILASSIAVYGPRNPHRISTPLTPDTPVRPFDVYGEHKVEAEAIVRDCGPDWVILRLGGVLSTQPRSGFDPDLLYFSAALPTDGRLQTVDVRDVAHAFGAAITADAAGRTWMIGGDDTHRLRQGDIAAAMAAAMGLAGALPTGRPGDPDDDDGWFATDWMDSGSAEQVLRFQHHSWPQMLAEITTRTGWKRYPLRLMAPLVREFLTRRSPYYRQPGRYANPWEAVRTRWGAPEADRRTP